MLDVQIKDGKGSKKSAEVTKNNELLTIATPYPPLSVQKVQPFRQYFTTDGTPTGSNDMGIDGSVTNVDFCVPSSGTDDRYISLISVLVGYGTTGQPYEWADGTALTNGMRLFYTSERGEVEIHDAIKTNQDMFRLNFASMANTWQLSGVNQNNDFGYILAIDLTEFGLIHGIKLDRGTNQKLVLRVRDNAGLAADSFNMIALGFDRFE